jgi:hypothetical protein
MLLVCLLGQLGDRTARHARHERPQPLLLGEHPAAPLGPLARPRADERPRAQQRVRQQAALEREVARGVAASFSNGWRHGVIVGA